MNKQRVWELLEVARPGDRVSQGVDYCLIALILMNVLAVIADSVHSIHLQYGRGLFLFELFSVAIFTIEYALRIWSSTAQARYRHPLTGRLRFAARPMSIVDLLAILPFYLPFLGIDLRIMRALRAMRIVRIVKLGRYNSAFLDIGKAIASKREELVLSTIVLILLLIISSSLMFFAENQAQPNAFPDIPTAMWWSVVTLTTVGYGDVYPITALGKTLAAVISVLGIGMVALPTGIIGASFVELVDRRKNSGASKCPHCGESID